MPAWSRLTTKSRIPEYLLCAKQEEPADVHFQPSTCHLGSRHLVNYVVSEV